VVGPGGLYTSLIPNLLVEGVSRALRETKAKKVFIVNLMNRRGQTNGFTVGHYIREMKRFTGVDVFDYILVNNGKPKKELIEKYAQEGEMVQNDIAADSRLILADLLSEVKSEYQDTDVLAKHRAFIRHDSGKLAKELMQIVTHI